MAVSEKDQITYELAPDFPEMEIFEKLSTSSKTEVEKFKPKKIRYALSQRQLHDLIDAALDNSKLHGMMIMTQASTGLRVGELVHLRMQDVNVIEGKIHVCYHYEDNYTGHWHPKTESGIRVVTIPSSLSKELKRFLKEDKRKHGYLFVSNKGSCFYEESVTGFINKYAKNTKSIGHNIGSHTLRRTYASWLVYDNIPIGDVSKSLGHKSIQITMQYLYQIENVASQEKIGRSIDKLMKDED